MVIHLTHNHILNLDQKSKFKWKKSQLTPSRYMLRSIQIKAIQWLNMEIRRSMVFLTSQVLWSISTQLLDNQLLQAIKPSPSIHKIPYRSSSLLTLPLNLCTQASKTRINMVFQTNKTTLLLFHHPRVTLWHQSTLHRWNMVRLILQWTHLRL
jgi:hypothetical protein